MDTTPCVKKYRRSTLENSHVEKVFTTKKGGPFGPPFLEGLPPTKEGKPIHG